MRASVAAALPSRMRGKATRYEQSKDRKVNARSRRIEYKLLQFACPRYQQSKVCTLYACYDVESSTFRVAAGDYWAEAPLILGTGDK